MEPEGKRASLSDIAKEAGVDASTVSLVLNRKPLAERLRPETRRRIIEIAEKLRYRPSAAARSLRTGRSGMIGMVVGDIASLFYSELTATALANAERNGRRLIVSATEWSKEKELKALENLLAAGVDGIIFLPGSLSEEHPLFRTIRSERIPLVTFDRKLSGTPAVHCDYRRGFAEAVARLAARHRRIGYLGARGEISNKIPSFREACSACGCEGIVCEFEGDDFSNFKLEPALFLGDGAPKAWLVGAGEASIYLLNHLLRQGIGIPGEIELVGTSVPRIGELCTPSVSYVELDCSALMRAAFELLGGGEEREIFVPTGFRPLGSCR